ncbi:MAG: hypothetical protein AAGA86_12420 [Bacteroidota bacterium]
MLHQLSTDLDQQQTTALSKFDQWLQKYFLADIGIYDCSLSKNSLCLGIEMDLSFDFINGISMLITPSPKKNKDMDSQDNAISNLRKHFQELGEGLQTNIRIKELALYFRDTAVVIHEVEDYELLGNLEEILRAASEHFRFFGNIEIPGDIHIPAVEQSEHMTQQTSMGAPSQKPVSPYLKHWALYYDTLEKALVYDINNTTFIVADLCLDPD